MVTINLTLLIQAGLFVLFLWAMDRLVVRPLIHVMDHREQQMHRDKQIAKEQTAEALRTEQEYRSQLAAIHRNASLRLGQAHREAQAAHLHRVNALKTQEAGELRAMRDAMREQIKRQRDEYPPLVDALFEHTARELGLERARR